MVAVLPELDDKGLYSIKQTCELLGVHRNTLRTWTEAGYIKFVTRLNKVLYRGSDIKHFFYTMDY